MALELLPTPAPAVGEAARRAIAAVGSAAASRKNGRRWWRAGIADAVAARAVAPASPRRYSALASPRSTRGEASAL